MTGFWFDTFFNFRERKRFTLLILIYFLMKFKALKIRHAYSSFQWMDLFAAADRNVTDHR